MKKKSILAGIMMLVTAFGMVFATGCGGNNKITEFEMPEGGFDTTKEVEIKFSHTMGKASRDVLDYYIKKFNELYPNITIKHEMVGDYDQLRDQLVTEISGGEQPNLAYCYPDHVALFNQSGAVLPLNDFLPDGAYANMDVAHADETTEKLGFTQAQKDDFIEAYYNEGFQFDDGSKMYTLPFAKSTEVMFYNKTYFEKEKLEVPTTWDELETVCAAIKAKDSTSIPLGYDSEANLFITLCEQYQSPFTSLSGEHFLFDNAKNREFVQKFKEWYDKGYFTTKDIYGKYTSNLFTTGDQCYMCIGSTGGASHQLPDKVDGVYPFEVGIAPLPQIDPENPKVISQGPSICIFKNDDPQEVLASWLFAKFCTTNDIFQANFSSVSGYVPVIKSALDVPAYKEAFENAEGENSFIAYLSAKICMGQEKANFTSPAFVGSSKARDEVGNLLKAVLTDSKTIDQAFEDAIEECRYSIIG